MALDFNFLSDTKNNQLISFNISGTTITGKHKAYVTGTKNGTGDYTATISPTSHEPFIVVFSQPQSATGCNVTVSSTAYNSVRLLIKEAASKQATLALNGITFFSKLVGKNGNNLTVTITGGATAGNEVVTFVNPYALTIQVETTVSTATQVMTALNGYMANNGAPSIFGWYLSGAGTETWATASAANLVGGVDVGDAKDAALHVVLLGSF